MKRSMSTMIESLWLPFEDTMSHRKILASQYIDRSLFRYDFLHHQRVLKTVTNL